ncbi:hypothetical protein EDC15_11766 [Acetobacter aceti NBRC 14818]|nr:hypothetical protein EDC15_11766 [Acetobacter aceti NBRC 14818]
MVLTCREIDRNQIQLRIGQGREKPDLVAVSGDVQIIEKHHGVSCDRR